MAKILFMPPNLYTKQLLSGAEKAINSDNKEEKETKTMSIARHVFRLLVGYFAFFYTAVGSFGYNALAGGFGVANYFTEQDAEKKAAWKKKISVHMQYAVMEAITAVVTYVRTLSAVFTACYMIVPKKVNDGYHYVETMVEEGIKKAKEKLDESPKSDKNDKSKNPSNAAGKTEKTNDTENTSENEKPTKTKTETETATKKKPKKKKFNLLEQAKHVANELREIL